MFSLEHFVNSYLIYSFGISHNNSYLQIETNKCSGIFWSAIFVEEKIWFIDDCPSLDRFTEVYRGSLQMFFRIAAPKKFWKTHKETPIFYKEFRCFFREFCSTFLLRQLTSFSSKTPASISTCLIYLLICFLKIFSPFSFSFKSSTLEWHSSSKYFLVVGNVFMPDWNSLTIL